MNASRSRRQRLAAVALASAACLWGSVSAGSASAGSSGVPATSGDVSAADYEAAAKLLGGDRGLVRNGTVEPHWIGNSGRFWYRRAGDAGPEFVVVTPTGRKSPAFDHARFARALAAALGGPAVGGNGLPEAVSDAELSEDLTHLKGRSGTKWFDCNVTALACQAIQEPQPVPPDVLPSPDGRWLALTHNDNLFVRDVATGRERKLTTDGAPYYSWAKLPDNSLTAVVRQKSGRKAPPFETYWSPDGRYLIAPRIDERRLATNPVVEWVPTDGSLRPIVHEVRLEFVGDRDGLQTQYFLFDLTTGGHVPIMLPEGFQAWPEGLVIGWSRARSQAFLVARTFGLKSIGIFRLSLATGDVRKVLEESSDTRVEMNTVLYSQPNVRLLGEGAELVWYSGGSGWGQLYLYDAQSGRLKNSITRGDWVVKDIVAVDEVRREIYYTGLGREPGRDPYFRHLYRSRLDGHGAPVLLTTPNADHQFESTLGGSSLRLYGLTPPGSLMDPAAQVFVDTWSTVNEPPISVLRSAHDGHTIVELEHADASRLFATGWVAPSRERVLAADGKTALYAVYTAAHGHATGRRQPVVDAAYGGPQAAITPRNFMQAYRDALNTESLARLGFGVVTVDGRGTPMRSSAFRDAGYPEFTQIGIDDHIAAIRELAERHPEMDLEHVGVYGWSWGGTFAAQAILSRPNFYRVAVAGAGVYDYAATYPGNDAFIGSPRYSNGTRYRGAPDDAPANWAAFDVTHLANQLRGHLLLIYGDLDENVPPSQTFRLIDALTRASKPYDLLYLPNRTHGSGLSDGYTTKRTWDYLLQYLLGETPVGDFKIERNSHD